MIDRTLHLHGKGVGNQQGNLEMEPGSPLPDQASLDITGNFGGGVSEDILLYSTRAYTESRS